MSKGADVAFWTTSPEGEASISCSWYPAPGGMVVIPSAAAPTVQAKWLTSSPAKSVTLSPVAGWRRKREASVREGGELQRTLWWHVCCGRGEG